VRDGPGLRFPGTVTVSDFVLGVYQQDGGKQRKSGVSGKGFRNTACILKLFHFLFFHNNNLSTNDYGEFLKTALAYRPHDNND
jgi:hypothetical protein